MKLSSQAFFDPAEDEAPHIEIERLEAHGAGLIALTGGPDGPIDKALREGQKEVAFERLKVLEKIFGDRLYVEIQRHGLKHEIEAEPTLLDLAYARALPIVATNEVYFASPDDYEAHDALLCIAEGTYVTEDKRRRLSRQHFFKTAEQMAELFADLPEALANTDRDRQALRLPAHRPQADPAALRRGGAGDERGGAARAGDGRAARPGRGRPRSSASPPRPWRRASRPTTTRKRLDFEIGVISKMKFPGYFLIVADFIQWAKANGIPVGPGRGSGAGSVVAWSLTITDLDPLRFGLLFERFLNPERISMPDFDIDFCQDRRDEVIRYVQKKLRRRPRGADHHPRQAAGARRAARRRARAADALRAGRQALQADPQQPGQPGDAGAGHRGRAQAAGGPRPRAGGGAAARDRTASSRGSTATPPRTPPAW